MAVGKLSQLFGGGGALTASTTTSEVSFSLGQMWPFFLPVNFGGVAYACGLDASTAAWKLLGSDGAACYFAVLHAGSRTVCWLKINQATGQASKLAETAYHGSLPIGAATQLAGGGVSGGAVWVVYAGNTSSTIYSSYFASISVNTGATAVAEVGLGGFVGIDRRYVLTAAQVSGCPFGLLLVSDIAGSGQNKLATVNVGTGAIAQAPDYFVGTGDTAGLANRSMLIGQALVVEATGSPDLKHARVAVNPATGALTGAMAGSTFQASGSNIMVPLQLGVQSAVWAKNLTTGADWQHDTTGVAALGADQLSGAIPARWGMVGGAAMWGCWQVSDGLSRCWSPTLVQSGGQRYLAARDIETELMGSGKLQLRAPLLSKTGSGQLAGLEVGAGYRVRLLASADGQPAITLPATTRAGSGGNPVIGSTRPLAFSTNCKAWLRWGTESHDAGGGGAGLAYGGQVVASFVS